MLILVVGNLLRFQDNCKRRHSQLPIGWRLLYGAKKISRQLSLLLSLVGMVIIGLITLGYPWIHFQVPLTLPGDPAGPRTIPINTVFFVRCPDISCLHEYDQNACKPCPRITFPGIHLSFVLGTPSCFPLHGPHCPGFGHFFLHDCPHYP